MKRKITVNFFVCVFLFVCYFSEEVFGSIANESISELSKNPTQSPNQEQEQVPECSFKCEDFKALENDNRELKKMVEELKEEFYTLRNELNELKNEGSASGWVLEPWRGPPGEKGDAGENGQDGRPGEKGDKGDRGPVGQKGEKGKSGPPGKTGAKGESGLIGAESPSTPIPECLDEKWVTVHHYNNTEFSDAKVVVTATVGVANQNLSQSDLLLDSTDYENSIEYTEISRSFQPAKLFAHIGKSKATGFDWTVTPSSMWTGETLVNKTYTCDAQSSCVLKQLVGQCEEFQVPVDKFCLVSAPIGSSVPKSCTDSKFKSCSNFMLVSPSTAAKTHVIYPHGKGNSKRVEVLCDFESDGGGWTVIQKRSSGPKHEFDREWNEYKNGFGSLDGNFWLGLDNIRALTKNGDQELRIELEDFKGEKRWAKYSSFSISDASDFYRLEIRGFYGNSTAGDSMTTSDYGLTTSNRRRFSTRDKNNDNKGYRCGTDPRGRGGWWFNIHCAESGLNGLYVKWGETTEGDKGIFWASWKGRGPLAKTEMKIRKRK